MRLVRFDDERGRDIDRFGSVGFRLTPLVHLSEGQAVCVRLAPGGRIGRHPAVGRQLFAVVAGAGAVSGEDGVDQAIGPGLAALWEDGEAHSTETAEGLTAIVFEGEALDVLADP